MFGAQKGPKAGQTPQKIVPPPHAFPNGMADWMLLAERSQDGKPSTGAAGPHTTQQLPPAPEHCCPPVQSLLEQQLALGMQLFDAPQYFVPPGHPQLPPGPEQLLNGSPQSALLQQVPLGMQVLEAPQ